MSGWVCPALYFSIIKSIIARIPLYPWSCSSQTITRKSPSKKEVSNDHGIQANMQAPSATVEFGLLFCCVYFISFFLPPLPLLCLLTAEVQISKSSKDGWGSALFDLSLYLTYIYQIVGFFWSILLFRLRNRYFLSYSTSFSIYVCFISLLAWGGVFRAAGDLWMFNLEKNYN